ncbi:MAG: YqeG family HAD IIIA-type phosphatase [Armatimonadota bacterium]
MHRFIVNYLAPREYAASLTEVCPKSLLARGIRGAILDLDNTLVPWNSSTIQPEVRQWVESALADGLHLCILSNTSRKKRLQTLGAELRIPCIRGRKPRRHSFREAMRILKTAPGETAVIGDQIFTDVFGGNRLGLYTILVRRIARKEFLGTYISRLAEALLLGYLRRCGREPWTENKQSQKHTAQQK